MPLSVTLLADCYRKNAGFAAIEAPGGLIEVGRLNSLRGMAKRGDRQKARGALQPVPTFFPDKASPRSNFDQAICLMIGLPPRSGITGMRDGRRAKILALFDGEATWSQIREWRRGRSKPPIWACERLAAKALETEQALAQSRKQFAYEREQRNYKSK